MPGGLPPGDPEQPEQSHDVVEPQPARVAEGGPDGLHERPVAGRLQPPGVERRQPPVLAPGVELVGRGADGHVEGEDVLPQPGVGAAWVDPHGQVVHDVDAGGRRRRQLEVEQPLQPLVEPHPVLVLPPVGRHLGRIGVTEAIGPPSPVLAVLLDQGAEGGVGLQRVGLPLPPPVEGGVAGEHGPQLLEGLELEMPHRVPVDAPLPVEGLAGRGELLEAPARQIRRPRHVLHPQVERVAEPPAAREVGAGRLREAGQGRVQGVDQDEAGTQRVRRPSRQTAEVAEVAHAPTHRRSGGVELHRPAPHGGAARGRAAAGADDDRRPRPVVEGGEGVIAEGQVGGQGAVDPDLASILGVKEGRAPDRHLLAGVGEEHRAPAVGTGPVGRCAHGAQDGVDRLPGAALPLAARVLVTLLNAPGLGVSREPAGGQWGTASARSRGRTPWPLRRTMPPTISAPPASRRRWKGSCRNRTPTVTAMTGTR